MNYKEIVQSYSKVQTTKFKVTLKFKPQSSKFKVTELP